MNKSNIIYRQGQSDAFYDMPLRVVWIPTMLCNYHCSYCQFNEHRPKQTDWLDLSDIEKILFSLSSLNRSSYTFEISGGGEPTFYPHLMASLKLIKDLFGRKIYKIYLATNGSKNIEYLQELVNSVTGIPFMVTISIHTEHFKPEMLEPVISVFSDKCELSFNLMYNPSKMEVVKEIYGSLCQQRLKHKFSLDIVTLREGHNGEQIDRRYTQEDFAWQTKALLDFTNLSAQLPIHDKNTVSPYVIQKVYQSDEGYKFDWLREHNFELREGFYNLKGMYCVQGTHLIGIWPSGVAANAICGDCHYTSSSACKLEPWKDENFIRIIKCNQDVCGCGANEILQKFSSRCEADIFLKHFREKQERATTELAAQRECAAILARQRFLMEQFHLSQSDLGVLVDSGYYLESYPDVAGSGMNPVEHWLKYGCKEGRNPNRWFNTLWYLETYPEVAQSKIDPLLYYVKYGISKGHRTAPDNQRG